MELTVNLIVAVFKEAHQHFGGFGGKEKIAFCLAMAVGPRSMSKFILPAGHQCDILALHIAISMRIVKHLASTTTASNC